MTRTLRIVKNSKMLVLLGAMVLAMSLATPHFLTTSNLLIVLVQTSTYGIMACGMTFAIISGEFDLSIGSVMALCGLISIVLAPLIGQALAIVVALATGCLVGAINGLLVAKLKISSFIVTIGTMGIVKGVALKVSGGAPVISQNAWFNALGHATILHVPWVGIVWAVVIGASAYCLARTRFGRNIYTIGGNIEVAYNSGVAVDFHRIMAFVICSLTGAVAGVLLASRLNTGSALYGDTAALSVISGVVVGGTSLAGGTGSIAKSMIGTLIFVLITVSLDLLRVYSYYQIAIRGLLLLGIIGMDALLRKRQ